MHFRLSQWTSDAVYPAGEVPSTRTYRPRWTTRWISLILLFFGLGGLGFALFDLLSRSAVSTGAAGPQSAALLLIPLVVGSLGLLYTKNKRIEIGPDGVRTFNWLGRIRFESNWSDVGIEPSRSSRYVLSIGSTSTTVAPEYERWPELVHGIMTVLPRDAKPSSLVRTTVPRKFRYRKAGLVRIGFGSLMAVNLGHSLLEWTLGARGADATSLVRFVLAAFMACCIALAVFHVILGWASLRSASIAVDTECIAMTDASGVQLRLAWNELLDVTLSYEHANKQIMVIVGRSGAISISDHVDGFRALCAAVWASLDGDPITV